MWVAEDKDGKPYLNIKVLNSINLKAFKNEPKREEKKETSLFG